MSNRPRKIFDIFDVIGVCRGDRSAEYYYQQDRAQAKRRIVSVADGLHRKQWVAQFNDRNQWRDLCDPTTRDAARDHMLPRSLQTRAIEVAA